jgi:hypothetical protein
MGSNVEINAAMVLFTNELVDAIGFSEPIALQVR